MKLKSKNCNDLIIGTRHRIKIILNKNSKLYLYKCKQSQTSKRHTHTQLISINKLSKFLKSNFNAKINTTILNKLQEFQTKSAKYIFKLLISSIQKKNVF